jgi:hypothetical protein
VGAQTPAPEGATLPVTSGNPSDRAGRQVPVRDITREMGLIGITETPKRAFVRDLLDRAFPVPPNGDDTLKNVRIVASAVDAGLDALGATAGSLANVPMVFLGPVWNALREVGVDESAIQTLQKTAHESLTLGIELGMPPGAAYGPLHAARVRRAMSAYEVERALPMAGAAIVGQGRPASAELQALEREYIQAAQLPMSRPPFPEAVDEARAMQIADAFEAMRHNPTEPAVAAAYDAFKRETLQQWNFLRSKGYTLEPWTKPGQPYRDSAEAIADVQHRRHRPITR